jgi:hypothetical protein
MLPMLLNLLSIRQIGGYIMVKNYLSRIYYYVSYNYSYHNVAKSNSWFFFGGGGGLGHFFEIGVNGI